MQLNNLIIIKLEGIFNQTVIFLDKEKNKFWNCFVLKLKSLLVFAIFEREVRNFEIMELAHISLN